MFLSRLTLLLTTGSLIGHCHAPPSSAFGYGAPFPDLPFTTKGRDIVAASGKNVVLSGVNWPGAADAMIPEGLQYSSIRNVAAEIQSLGMNVVRLTFAIEMVDDVLLNNPNSTLQNSLTHALGAENGTKVLQQILKNNPQFASTTTRLQVFDAVADELAKHQIYVHLDNHMSKGKWCCGTRRDGNTWFGDTEFPVYNWQRGLGYMAKHGKSWKSLASIGMRNELRSPDTPGNSALPYNWQTWYENMVPAAEIVHGNNSNVQIYFSGLGFDTDVSALANKQDLGNGHYFNPSSFDFANRIVVELHNYNNRAKNCENNIASGLRARGFNAMDVNNTGYYHVPIVLTEFGFDQNTDAGRSVYAQCLRQFISQQPGGPGGWEQWVIVGSYYIREGIQDFDETWGLFNHDWSDWRNATAAAYTRSFVQASHS